MNWEQTFTIIGVLGGFMFFMLQRIEKDIDGMNTNIDKLGRRIDGHATRIDQLYHIIIDILKEGKK